jgi:hypothetical protein
VAQVPSINIEARGPEEIRAALSAAIGTAGERAEDVAGIAAVLDEAADRYQGLGMVASTVEHLRGAAGAAGAAGERLAAGGQHLQAALADFEARDGQVAAAVAAAGHLAGTPILTGDAAGDTATTTGLTAQTSAAADRERVRADRVAKVDLIEPLAQLAAEAETMSEILDDPDSDEDPEELLARLIARVRSMATGAGLGPVAEPGTKTTYDPKWHWALGDAPEPGSRVVIQSPGQQWTHAGDRFRLSPASVARIDDVHGVHIVGPVTDLGEGEEAEIWLDDTSPQPDTYTEPGWYRVAGVEDCDGTVEFDGHAAGPCDGQVVWFADPEDEDEWPAHYPAGARAIYNNGDQS